MVAKFKTDILNRTFVLVLDWSLMFVGMANNKCCHSCTFHGSTGLENGSLPAIINFNMCGTACQIAARPLGYHQAKWAVSDRDKL